MGILVRALLVCLSLSGGRASATIAGRAGGPASDPLSAMFSWWNRAIRQPGAMTPTAFGQYFTSDASLVINGQVFAHGLRELSDHFSKIQKKGGEVEIVMPFIKTFRQGDDIYTYHLVRRASGLDVSCLYASGYGHVRDGKLDLVMLIRSSVAAAASPPCR